MCEPRDEITIRNTAHDQRTGEPAGREENFDRAMLLSGNGEEWTRYRQWAEKASRDVMNEILRGK